MKQRQIFQSYFFGTLRCVIDKYLFILNCVQVLV